jgi:probable HAF family extracellular repeat protein
MFLIALPASTTGGLAQRGPVAQNSPRFRIVDLGPVPHDSEEIGMGLNATGDVAGWVEAGDGIRRAVVWRYGKSNMLARLAGHEQNYAVALNGRGQVVGLAKLRGDLRFNHAFLAQNGRLAELGSLGGKYSVGRAINDTGQIAGDSMTADAQRHAFLWQNGIMRDLGTLGKGNTSMAYDISNRTLIVGSSNVEPNGKSHAFLWQGGQMRDLGLLPGGTSSCAQQINEHGQIAGWADDAEAEIHACLWQHGAIRDLGTLGYTPCRAWSVNNRGQVVGMATTVGEVAHAFLWEDGRIMDLNGLIPAGSGWLLRVAFRINTRGQIVGQGWRAGVIHGFLLTPWSEDRLAPSGRKKENPGKRQ